MKIVHISRNWRLVLAFGAVALLAATAFAANPTFVGTLVPHGDGSVINCVGADGEEGPCDVLSFLAGFVHGSATSWHYHTGDHYELVRQGTVVQDLGCGDVKEFPTGTALYLPAGTVHQVRNEGNKEAQVSLFQVQVQGLPLNRLAPEPTDCP